MGFKCYILMLLLLEMAKMAKTHVIRSIQSEDGDMIDCIDIYKQPAFDHPALKDHKIQLNPSDDGQQLHAHSAITQIWHKSGTCPKGTIPVRRMKNQFNESKELYLLQKNHSLAILHAEGFAYFGAKGDIKVWNPKVEWDDEYTTSRVALKNGPRNNYQAVESGWVVNPKVYGDRQTRVYVYWTADGSNKTGCFDLACPGFVQTSNQIALGAAIYPISNPHGLSSQITIYIHKDPRTSNWWVQYGERINVGYWPGDLFAMLRYHAETVQWGGEVYSSRVGGVRPHTATAMGSGHFSDFVFGTSGWVKRMRVLRNNGALESPQWVNSHTDEYRCYDVMYLHDYVEDPEFYFGGPGRNPMCP